jgi:hypothetical protein
MKYCTRPEIFIAASGHCGMMQDNQSAAQAKTKGDKE